MKAKLELEAMHERLCLQLSKENIIELWGIFLGLIVGFIITKVYQSWCILFISDGLNYAGINSWSGTALWEVATKYPFGFLVVVETLFAAIGYLFIKTYFKHIK